MNLTTVTSGPPAPATQRNAQRFREANAICIEAGADRVTSAQPAPHTPELGQSALLILAQSHAVLIRGASDAAFVAQSYRRLPPIPALAGSAARV